LDEQGRAQQELFAGDELPVVRNRGSPWVGEHKGFSLHAGVSFGTLDKNGRETLVRYCVRPALSLQRLSVLRDGSIAYKVKYKVRGGRTHRVMQSTEFMARLASLVAPPRIPLTRYHGVLAPRSSWRRQVVPLSARSDAACAHNKPKRVAASASKPQPAPAAGPIAVHQFTSPIAQQPAANLPATATVAAPSKPRSRTSTSYVPWHILMRRTFGIEVLECTSCHATMRAIAVITQLNVIEMILSHVRLPLSPQPTVDGFSVQYEVTDEDIPDWVLGVDPEPEPCERGPPSQYDGVDPPSPEE
jgi:hypothetical protein